MNTNINRKVNDYKKNFAELLDCVMSKEVEIVQYTKDVNHTITVVYNYAYGYAMVIDEKLDMHRMKLTPELQKIGLNECQESLKDGTINHILDWN